METRHETWDPFWAQKLRLEFFAGQWDRYRKAADARAQWLEQTFNLDKSRPVLSLACGEGGIELALARRGFRVTGIDANSAFVFHAREQASDEGLDATFLKEDLRREMELPGGNGLVCCFDTFGLLAEDDEQSLIVMMAQALAPDGLLLVDSPQREAQKSARNWWPQADGFLLQTTRWDKVSNILQTEPLFISEEGEKIELVDPYDKSRGEHSGILRYIYTPDELVRKVRAAGLGAEAGNHQRPGYFMVVGSRQLHQSEPVDDTPQEWQTRK
jgi:SAM-dependent methyltransferase